jgi:hypothetical protein
LSSLLVQWRGDDEAGPLSLVGQLGPIADPERATAQVIGEGATEESHATEPFDVENYIALGQRVIRARAGGKLCPCDLVSTDTKNDVFALHLTIRGQK